VVNPAKITPFTS